MIKKNVFIIIIVCFVQQSCEKINLQKADDNVSVVEGYLIPGDPVKIKVTKQLVYSSNDTVIQKLDMLNIYLQCDDETYRLENTGDGIYVNDSINVKEESEYFLFFEYNNKMVSALTEIPVKPKGYSISSTTIEAFSFGEFEPGSGTPPERPEDVTITWDNPNGDYFMIVVENIEDDPELINSDTDRPPRIFRNAPTQGNTQSLNPMTFDYYGRHRVILFSLNAEYAALYERLGRSSLDISAPPSNVGNGLGIFTGINSDTLFIKVVEQ